MKAAELREILRSPDQITKNAFSVLKGIAEAINSEDGPLAREMVLRALEHRKSFGGSHELLDTFAREVGLFPYIKPESLDVRDSIAYEFNRPLNMGEEIVFHREQAEVYRRLLAGDSVILSAPTSFGKSRIIDAIIASGRYNNIAVIVPTLALIDETRRRLSTFSDRYKIVTHLSQRPEAKNIFVLTAERAVAYDDFPKIEFFVIDEFYKIGALQEDSNRTVALNQAFYKLRKHGGQFYLLGPNIQEIPEGLESAFRCFFYPTNYSTVVAEQVQVPGSAYDKMSRLLNLAEGFDEPTLIFCSSPSKVSDVADALITAGLGIDTTELAGASEWAGEEYHADWVFSRAIVKGIGIHHGRLPRALAQYVVRMFNEEKLRFLICTSTLIEGVNTKAKNVVLYDNTINRKQIDYFTFNNIKGRSGRMFEHFVGKAYLFDAPPQEQLPFVDFPLFTQNSNTPTSLLVQLDQLDLTPSSKERVKRFTNDESLPLAIIKTNTSIDPESQINLAKEIQHQARILSPKLAWTRFPKYEQLKTVCELIWAHFVDSNRRSGVFSGSQLTQKTWQLMATKSSAVRVKNELEGKYAAKSVDEAVERVLQFERTWAGFELPKYLNAISRIQEHVLGKLGLPYGNYTTFAGQAECYFRTPVIAALDEYGIPLQLAEKIQSTLKITDNLDEALENLKRLNIATLPLSDFEKEILLDAQHAL